jgi:hypothetical protein
LAVVPAEEEVHHGEHLLMADWALAEVEEVALHGVQ